MWRLHGRGLAMALAALFGAVICVIEFSPGFLTGTGPFWQFPVVDQAAFLGAAYYHLHDHWRIPIFSIPAMGYPEGGSVIWNDAVPLGALLAKIFYTLTAMPVNYLGWWPLLVFVLQGAMAARFVWAIGCRSPLATAAIAGLAVACVPLTIRFVHFAMMSQFLIPWALALYAEQVNARKPAIIEPTLLAIVAILISPYITAMAVPILAAAWLTLAIQGHLQVRALWRPTLVAAVTVVLVMALAGFFSMPGRGSQAITAFREYGLWSWNIATLFVPPKHGLLSPLTDSLRKDMTGGQYEGESYIGLVPVLLFLLCLVMRPRDVRNAIVRHWPLAAVLLLFAAYAASTTVYLGQIRLIALPVPDWFQQLSANLRVHGRFVWPLLYALILVPAALLVRGRTSVTVTALLIVGLAVQTVEVAPTLRWGREYTSTATTPMFDGARMTSWMELHDRVYQYPSWYCGALDTVQEKHTQARARLSQLQVLAARLNKPNNSAHMARPLLTCSADREFAVEPKFQPGTLYIILKDTRVQSPRVEVLEHTDRCIDEGWSYVCSANPRFGKNADAGEPPHASASH